MHVYAFLAKLNEGFVHWYLDNHELDPKSFPYEVTMSEWLEIMAEFASMDPTMLEEGFARENPRALNDG